MRRNRCVCPHCKPRNPATSCGHDHCPPDECTALREFVRVDYTTPGFERPDGRIDP